VVKLKLGFIPWICPGWTVRGTCPPDYQVLHGKTCQLHVYTSVTRRWTRRGARRLAEVYNARRRDRRDTLWTPTRIGGAAR
jgi:hypothetical protein